MPHNITLFVSLMLIMGVFNHLRGGGHGFGDLVANTLKKLPGRPLYYVSVFVGLVTLALSRNPSYAAIAALGYLIWGAPSWGRMFDMGNLSHDYSRKGEPLSDMVLSLLPPSRGADAAAMFVRELYVLPFLLAAYWYIGRPWYYALIMAVVYATGAVVMRLAAMRNPSMPASYKNFMAEITIGMLWGAIIGSLIVVHMR